MSKANPLEAKTLAQLEKMAKDKKESRAKHQKSVTKLAKEIAAIEREITIRNLTKENDELKKQTAAKAPAAKK